MNQDTAYNRMKAALNLLSAIEGAMQATANTDIAADVTENGDVRLDKQIVREAVWESGNACKAYDRVFDLLWDDVADKAECTHRQKWAEDRERRRSELMEDASIRAGVRREVKAMGA